MGREAIRLDRPRRWPFRAWLGGAQWRTHDNHQAVPMTTMYTAVTRQVSTHSFYIQTARHTTYKACLVPSPVILEKCCSGGGQKSLG